MHCFRTLKLLLVLLLLSSLPGVNARTVTDDVAPLAPAAQLNALDRTIANLLSQHHYRQSKLDDRLSSLILNTYLDDLDANHAYFLASDIAAFEKYRSTLDDALKNGNLQPAYEIFNVYLQRLGERSERIQALLGQDFRFDSDETLNVDRKNAPWARSAAELDEFWRKRLKHEMLTLIVSGKEPAAARELLRKRYENRLNQARQTSSKDVFQLYMNAVAQSFDPHTAYFSPRNTENFNIQMRLSLEGIGCVLRMEDEQVTVVELVTGGPADLSQQIKANDRIVAVAQGDDGPWIDVVGWRLDDVVERIRGARGSVVRLKILPGKAGAAAAEKTVRLVRDTIKLDKQAAKSEIKTLRDSDGRERRIGVITIPAFYSDFEAARRGDPDYRSTTRDVRRLLGELHGKVDGLVLDLRGNGGGSLQEAIDLTGLFIAEGPVVQVKHTRGDVEVEKDGDPEQVYDGPLAVLVDHASASASEIFAGAIQDYGRGLVIGDPTFGKGTVQTMIDLNRLTRAAEPQGQLKLTIAKFYRVNGSSTQHRGVRPDIDIPSVFDSEEIGESAQKNALPWDEIAATRFRNDRRLLALLPELSKRHQVRATSDPDYQSYLQDLRFSREQREKTTVSLRESQRRAEQNRIETWQRERENRYRALKNLAPLQPGDDLPQGKESAIPDAALQESVHIVADLIALNGGKAPGTVVMNR
ncbi:MAG TPA: carboxy terminal-processing peptidase [Candidatus Competibacteraceae bacterium]|nr:carboxy terminal-processing peptidase [Candidatus Competibacteraceae bacterium]